MDKKFLNLSAKCRCCGGRKLSIFLDLGVAPYSNAYLSDVDLEKTELYHPLKVMLCNYCWLAQTTDASNEKKIFNKNYAYFSSTSTSWVKHARDFSVKIIKELGLNAKSFVVEVASNDGYLLTNFVEMGIPNLGIEPTKSTAKVARSRGVKVLENFFTKSLAAEIKIDHGKADLIIGNNVYAHVPDINDFTQGIKVLLNNNGVVTLEFPHILNLFKYNQFDTIYHEHYSYFSLLTINHIFNKNGLRVWRVEEIPTHGGSLRIYGCLKTSRIKADESIEAVLTKEKKFGLTKIETYHKLQKNAEKIKNGLLEFLINQKKMGKRTVAYGAAAKGNTFLNYAGIRSDLISYVVDSSPSKQSKYMPGSRLKIYPPSQLKIEKPDNILVLPWNIYKEIRSNVEVMGIKKCKFIMAIPRLEILD